MSIIPFLIIGSSLHTPPDSEPHLNIDHDNDVVARSQNDCPKSMYTHDRANVAIIKHSLPCSLSAGKWLSDE